jgi:hypothetical protein
MLLISSESFEPLKSFVLFNHQAPKFTQVKTISFPQAFSYSIISFKIASFSLKK